MWGVAQGVGQLILASNLVPIALTYPLALGVLAQTLK